MISPPPVQVNLIEVFNLAMKKLLPLILCILPVFTGMATAAERVFNHPGVLHSRASLDVMREKIKADEEPWKTAFERFRKDGRTSADYRMQGPYEKISRKPYMHNAQADRDFQVAYFNAVMWAITGEKRHAAKAMEILDAYADTFQGYSDEDKDRQLTASLGPFLLINAAEIIRHTDAGWPEENAVKFEQFLKTRVLPAIQDFAPFANGNWDTGCIKTVMAIGVFCDDEAVFGRGVAYFKNGEGNGRLTHYVVNETGQCQESGRDQQHTQLGLGHLAEAAEVAYNQGVDLYSLADNRLLVGFEYTAKYNLGEDVPFTEHTDTTGKYRHRALSDEGRGRLRPIYEMVWNHYGRRMKLDAPYTRRAAETLRPEGALSNDDHPGYGTLLFTQP